ncbi:MAG: lysophospholipid acyltransferase family protein [Bacteroidales bacterium]|jgi:KDO2-lipid IV(A) lauroyltransferase|nr:lysophospholipid acyltransferase family protein [Bacteroidales bacterium]
MRFVLYILFYAVCWTLAFLPFKALYVISDILYFCIYYLVGYRRKVVMKNLHNAFPEKTEDERTRIAKRFYHFLCDMFVETIKVMHLSLPQMQRHIRYSRPEMIEELYRKGKQVICVTGHYGNWEWLASLGHPVSYQLATLYHPLQNKYFDRFYYRLRTKSGIEAIPSGMAVRAISRYHSQNRLTILCLLADQAPIDHPANYWTTFLHQESAVFMGAEKLAKRFDTAVLYYEIRRVKRGYYEVDTTLITENASEMNEYEITDRHVALLEQTIRKTPQYWLWTHRRWKRKRKSDEFTLSDG